MEPDLVAVGVLSGDPTKLTQALLNYISNAVKFTEKGKVTARGSIVENSKNQLLVRLEVQDTGIGIPAGQVKSLFAPFEQWDGSITRRFGGTGLGLVITSRLVQVMGGKSGWKVSRAWEVLSG